MVERFGLQLRRRLGGLGPASRIGGVLLGACLGLTAAWVLGSVALQVGSLGGQVRRSAILGRLDALLPPPGPAPATKVAYSLPTFAGPPPAVAPADPRVTGAAGVRRAGRSVVEIGGVACGHTRSSRSAAPSPARRAISRAKPFRRGAASRRAPSPSDRQLLSRGTA